MPVFHFGAKCDDDAIDSDIVAEDPIAERDEIERLRCRNPGAGDLAVEVDLWCGAELALE